MDPPHPSVTYTGKGTKEGTQETSPEADENGSRWLTSAHCVYTRTDFISSYLHPALNLL